MTGFDAVGWEAATWVLHSIYEDVAIDGGATHDDVRREAVARGSESPLIIGSVNLDEQSTVIGNSLGMSEPPIEKCVRLRWRDLAARLSITFDVNEVPPCFRWFPYRSWPASLHPLTKDRSTVSAWRRLSINGRGPQASIG